MLDMSIIDKRFMPDGRIRILTEDKVMFVPYPVSSIDEVEIIDRPEYEEMIRRVNFSCFYERS